MKKSILETFLKKYTVGGAVNPAKWVINDVTKQLSVSAISESRTMMVDVTLAEFSELPSSEVGIFDPTKLVQMLKVLGDDITITINKNEEGTKITSLSFSDTSAEVTFAAADLDVIPKSSIKYLPEFEIEVIFNDALISKFIKTKSALNEAESFTVLTNKKKNKLEIVVGHGKTNVNKIILDIISKNDKNIALEPTNFNVIHLKDILTNNDCQESVFRISNGGLAAISFTKDNFSTNYYLSRIKNVD